MCVLLIISLVIRILFSENKAKVVPSLKNLVHDTKNA